MARVAFIGLGNMGGGMAANLVKAGHEVRAFDLSEAALAKAEKSGCLPMGSATEAVRDAEAVVTMLPAGKHVRQVYETSVIREAPTSALLIDCSTIDVATARDEIAKAEEAGYRMVDAPVSGGIAAADAGTLTFMVGGSDEAFEAARPFLEAMGKAVIHAGGAGAGQAAKICNNMLLGIHMISVAEAFCLAERLGLAADRLFEIVQGSSGQCWSMTSYCPVPGLAPAAASNRDFRPGFTTAMMLKDLKLAQAAAAGVGASTPLGAEAAQLFNLFASAGNEALDFSAIIKMIGPKAP
jgi:3-hydroxyisobutyrate dehydrogenase